MKKLGYAIIFIMFVWRYNLSIACTYQPGMGEALEVLSGLDQAYRFHLDDMRYPYYINTLIQIGKYPNGYDGIPGFSKKIVGGIDLTRSANDQEACLISKAIMRAAIFANDPTKEYTTLNHYQKAFQANFSPIIRQHLKIAILTAELAIAAKGVIDFNKKVTQDFTLQKQERKKIELKGNGRGRGKVEEESRVEEALQGVCLLGILLFVHFLITTTIITINLLPLRSSWTP